MRKLQDTVKGHRLFTTFDAPYLIPVIATPLRQLLLGEAPFNPQLFDLLAEQNQCAGHVV